MKMVTIKINGIEMKVQEGETILRAAKGLGIEIPTLCYDERLCAYGACRLCSVEIIRDAKSRIVASCLYPVEDGLTVETESPRVIKIRRVILELLQARSPGLEEELSIKYKTKEGKFEKEPTFCILCGLCVRYCSEVKKANALGFVGRGIERQVVLFPEIASKTCPSCKECFRLCPTGILPSDFAISVPHFGKLPTVFPVRLRDEQNLRDLSKRIT